MIYRVYNQGEIVPLSDGWRSVIALTPGRKWITLIDWTTLETARIEIATWHNLRPQPEHGMKPRKVRVIMRRRLKYVTSTRVIQEALRLVQGSTHDG